MVQKSSNDLTQEFLELTKDAGEVGALLRSVDWTNTAVGRFETWPQSLKTALSICLGSKFPMFVWWGRDLTVFYNDAYIPLTGMKHPMYLGKKAQEQWAEIWQDLRPMTESVFETGFATWSESMLLYMTRRGFLEETYFTFSYSPIRDESGAVAGIINPCQETTEQILSERRLKNLHELGDREFKTIEDGGISMANVLGANGRDIPFVMIYETSADEKTARLIGSFGVKEGTAFAPLVYDLETHQQWPFGKVIRTRQPERVNGLRAAFPGLLPLTPYEEGPDSAFLLPVSNHGLLVLGISSRLEFNDRYQDYFHLIAKQVATHLVNLRALRDEQLRSESLLELDRAKTTFFSNVSHEFRTPLTLLLGPAEEALHDPKNRLQPKNQERMELIYRNSLRLQKLVNSLLDFSRLEAGRMQVNYQCLDISRFTMAIASSFHTAIAGAGLHYEINCEPVVHDTFVDPDLWEKVVLNLISNAIKFTLNGRILIHLYEDLGSVYLEVSDTGVGIPEKDMANIFQRFYRVEGVKARTHEGSGIGLSLVSEIVKLHCGTISVKSKPGQGTTFTVAIPQGVAHLPADKIRGEKINPQPVQMTGYLEEASHWGSRVSGPPTEKMDGRCKSGRRFRIVLADDSLDMRNYIHQLLLESGNNWEVLTAVNGKEALELVRSKKPHLVLTDVMMPVLDGFGLLKAIRSDENLRSTPVIFLSARAGEEAKVEGIEKGADDYLIKPFSAKELIARVNTQLEMSSMRFEVAQQAQANTAKSQFIANMSHELRTPLGVVLGFAELMSDSSTSEIERQEYLKAIIRNGQHLVYLIDELLDLSKIEANQLKVESMMFSLGELIDDVANVLRLRAETKGLPLRITYDGEVPSSITSDPVRLKQVLLDLGDNAIKFTEEGQIELKIKYYRKDSKVEIAVTDSGIGMSYEQQTKIFQTFVQVDNSMTRRYGGTGLGLVVSRKLARALGGDLVLKQSQLHKGSTFVLTLRDETHRPPQRKAPPVQSIETPLKAIKILLVEDSLDNQILTSFILKSAGAGVDCAADGEEGVRAAMSADYDLVLMDLQMPHKDGYEATIELRRHDFLKPIIALTAHTMKGDRERCLQNGFNDHLGKPINKTLLIDTIKSWTQENGSSQALPC